jgi:hypothetical protein
MINMNSTEEIQMDIQELRDFLETLVVV